MVIGQDSALDRGVVGGMQISPYPPNLEVQLVVEFWDCGPTSGPTSRRCARFGCSFFPPALRVFPLSSERGRLETGEACNLLFFRFRSVASSKTS